MLIFFSLTFNKRKAEAVDFCSNSAKAVTWGNGLMSSRCVLMSSTAKPRGEEKNGVFLLVFGK